MAILHHALLGLSVWALMAAGFRGASRVAPSGLERLVTAAVLGAATAVAEALLLGLVRLGASPVALPVASVAIWAVTRRALPEPAVPPCSELASWWRASSPRVRITLGAFAGAGAAWAAWQLRYPAIGFDTMHYHLPEIVLWDQRGSPGTVEDVLPGLPVGNYPLTNEVLIAWAQGISHSLVPLTLWPWVTWALSAAAGWLGFRALGVRRGAAMLGIAALCAAPAVLAWQSNGGMTDPPALAWLVVCAALCAAAPRRPSLLAPAILAGGLAVGTKTTVLPLTLVALGAGAWSVRAALRSERNALGLAFAGALLVGGGWYVRNLVLHGSPFWPLVAAPWGDPVPAAVAAAHTTFLERPAYTVQRIGDAYVNRFGGGLVLIAGGLVAPLLVRRRAVVLAGAAAAIGLGIWARSPLTGVPRVAGLEETTFSTTRYLLPVIAAAVLALALAASDRRARVRLAAGGILLAGVLIELDQTLRLGFATAPSVRVPLAGAVAGGLVTAAAASTSARLNAFGERARRWVRIPAFALAALSAAILGAALTPAAHHYVERYAATRALLTGSVVSWMVSQPSFARGQPVLTTPTFIGVLAGNDLGHRLETILPREPCARIAARARRAWVVVYGGPLGGAPPARVSACLSPQRPAFTNGVFRVFAPRS